MEDNMKEYVEKFESDVNDIRNLINEAKEALHSTDWEGDMTLRNEYESDIIFLESQLELSIKHHKAMLGIT